MRAASAEGALPQAEPPAFSLEIPADHSHGDWACNAAMAGARAYRMAPRKIAEAIEAKLDLSGTYFTRCEIAGPGFLNFFLSPRFYADVLRDVEKEGEAYGRSDYGKGEKIMVEFVSANPTGPMHMGNARGGALGDCLAAVLEAAGYDVWREFYVNDAGNQIEKFGVSLEARYLQIFRGEDNVPFPEDGYHGDDIREHAQHYADEFGDKLLEVPEEERRAALVAYALPKNIARMQNDLKKYRIVYDRWFLESGLHKDGEVRAVVDLLTEKGLTYEKEGAIWYHGHVARMKGAMDAIGLDGSKLDVVLIQLVRLVRDGEVVRMSKRSGKAIQLADLLDEVPIDAARFLFNMREANSQMDFDLDLAVQQDSQNPVYYVQYAHARICSLLQKLAGEGLTLRPCTDGELALLRTPEEVELMRHLAMFTDEIVAAARAYDPARITHYVITLATLFHSFYNACRIGGEEDSLAHARLALCSAVRIVLRNVLCMFKITAPERM